MSNFWLPEKKRWKIRCITFSLDQIVSAELKEIWGERHAGGICRLTYKGER